MADAVVATPAAAAVPAGTESATGQPGAKETQAQKAARLRVDLGDGEQEYEQSHLTELAKRGRKASQTMSLAEKRAQEAIQKERAADERFAALKSGDMKKVRSALKELGLNERDLANTIGQDMLEDMELEKDPVRRKLRDAERKLQEVDEGKKSEAEKQKQAAAKQEEERYTHELSETFQDVMKRTGLPVETATTTFPRVAMIFSAIESTGAPVDPDLVAARIRSTLEAEHKALYFKDDGKGGKAVNVEAIRALFGEDGLRAIQKEAVTSWKAKQSAGQVPPAAPPAARRETSQETPAPRAGNYWRSLEKQFNQKP